MDGLFQQVAGESPLSLIQRVLGPLKGTKTQEVPFDKQISEFATPWSRQEAEKKIYPTKQFSVPAILKANIPEEQKQKLLNEQTSITKETLQRLPGEIKETTADALLKLPNAARRFLGIVKKPDYRDLKDTFIETYGLTDVASNLWDDLKFELKAEGEDDVTGLGGLYTTKRSAIVSLLDSILPESIGAKIPEEIYHKLPPYNKPEISVYQYKPRVVLHELGHHFLEEGIIAQDKDRSIINGIMNEWQYLNEQGNYFTVFIDSTIQEVYGDQIEPRRLLGERYAIMFEIAAAYGSEHIPTELKKYIKPFIETESRLDKGYRTIIK